MKTAVESSVVEKAKSDLKTMNEILDVKYPGYWSVNKSDLFKGEMKISENDEIVDFLGSLTENTITFFLDDSRVATNVIIDGKRAVGTKASEEVIEKTLRKGEMFLGEANVVGNLFQTAYIPIKDKNNKIIGMFYTGISKTKLEKIIDDSLYNMIMIAIFFVVIVIFVSYFFGKKISKTIKLLLFKTEENITQIVNGNLSYKTDFDGIEDEFVPLLNGINDLSNAFNKPINVILLYLSDISKGVLPEKIKDEYKGDFNEIKNSINSVIDVINGIQSKILRVCEDAKKENFSSRADFGMMQGEWKNMLIGVN
ncbi:MAG: cache domain-containing protein, partial [Fusobacteriaceae bacterium]|nr:cache domain-containing protein [Fusobacteriaceae bacterium]